jgi:hypothetical protein
MLLDYGYQMSNVPDAVLQSDLLSSIQLSVGWLVSFRPHEICRSRGREREREKRMRERERERKRESGRERGERHREKERKSV